MRWHSFIGGFVAGFVMSLLLAVSASLSATTRSECPECPLCSNNGDPVSRNNEDVTPLVASIDASATVLPPHGEMVLGGTPLYDGLCEENVIGEKQIWNKHKKIISFSMFSPPGMEDVLSWVKSGVTINAKLAKVYYPDWVVRVYTMGVSVQNIRDMLLQNEDNLEIVRCHRHNSSARMMLTRFLAIDDPTVRYAIFRDLDSRLNVREMMAVNEWIASGLDFHSMRDHNGHIVPVMGGSFGMRRGLFGNSTSMTKLVKYALAKYEYPEEIPGCCGEDQNFLSMFVWPHVKSKTIDHDMDPTRCSQHGAKMCRPWPLGPRNQTERFYVGAPFKQQPNFTGYQCSVRCEKGF